MARSRDAETAAKLREQLQSLQEQLNELEDEPRQRSPGRRSKLEADRGFYGDSDPDESAQLDLEGFQVFTGRRIRAGSLTPRAAIQRRGNLSLNRASFLALGQPKAVIYAYNPDAREIAIKGASNTLPYAMPVRQQANAKSYLMSAGSFLNSIGLEIDHGVLAFDSVEVRDGVLILPIDSARQVATRPRIKREQGGP
jgi:hypothetical protein